MKQKTLFKTVGLAFGAMMISACSSTGDVNEGAASEATAIQQQAEEQAQEQATTAVSSAALEGEALQAEANEAQAALLQQTVFYFDFDQSTIKNESKVALIAHAGYLAANGAARVVLEGHTDERGTVEYNLALGERRALSVRGFLLANGASANQIQVVSFGEERPAINASNEEAYAKNRRVEVKYQSR